jgi:hypothetical protein
MASIDARAKKLEKQVAALQKQVAKQHLAAGNLRQEVTNCEKWIKAEVVWSKQVTDMLRGVDWDVLAKAYPYPVHGAGNPPQSPPDWPMTKGRGR